MIVLTIKDPNGLYQMTPVSTDDPVRARQIKALHESMGDVVEWSEDGAG